MAVLFVDFTRAPEPKMAMAEVSVPALALELHQEARSSALGGQRVNGHEALVLLSAVDDPTGTFIDLRAFFEKIYALYCYNVSDNIEFVPRILSQSTPGIIAINSQDAFVDLGHKCFLTVMGQLKRR